MKPLDNEKGQGAGTPHPKATAQQATAYSAYSSRKLSGKRESGHKRPCGVEAAYRRSNVHKTACQALEIVSNACLALVSNVQRWGRFITVKTGGPTTNS